MDTIPRLSLNSLAVALLGTSSLLILYYIAWAVYAFYFHPLSRFPGPKLWIISRLPYIQALQSGTIVQRVHGFHLKYGSIVRLAHDELSFVDADAWEDIYAHHPGKPDFPRAPVYDMASVNGADSIITAKDSDHARIRRPLAHGFSDKAVREQEPMVQGYVDTLMAKLRKSISGIDADKSIDLVHEFNYTTFDLIGDLGLGESFHCLQNNDYHPWVKVLLGNFKAVVYIVSCTYIPGIRTLLGWVMRSNMVFQKRLAHLAFVQAQVAKRLELGSKSDRPDLLSHLCRHNNEKTISVAEIEATFDILMIAGSETVSTQLTAIIHNLLKADAIYRALVDEIRGSFRQESEIDGQRVTKLPYLNAIIEETLRLCPAGPPPLARIVPPRGAEVCGYWLPGKTFVSISPFAIQRSSTNFSEPESFLPSRFLPPGHTDARSYPVHNLKAFHPFSFGPRNCIGQRQAYLELRLILARLLWNFDIERSGADYEWADQKVYLLIERYPLHVRLRPASL